MRCGVAPATVALLLAGCSREPAHVKVDPALAGLAPPDAVMLAGVRMDAIRATPVYQKWAGGGQFVDLDKFAQESGLDPRKDVSELLFASDGKQSVVLAKGKLPVQELQALLERSGAKKIAHRDRTLYGTEEAAVVFLNSSTAAAGPAAALRALIDRRSGGIAAPFQERLKSIAPETQIWMVAMGFNPVLEKAVPDTGNLGNLRRILASIENTTLALDLRSGLNITANGACRTEQDAKFIHDGIRGLLGMGRLSTPDNEPDLLRFYDAFQVSQLKNSVSVKAEIPMDLLEKFVGRIERLRRG